MIRRNEKKKKPWFWESDKREAAVRPSLPSGYRMEMYTGRGGERIQLSGMDRILKYGDEEILFRAGRARVLLCGKGLHITVFRYGTVEVCGRMSELRFMGEHE